MDIEKHTKQDNLKTVSLEILSKNRVGLVHEIVTTISSQNVAMKSSDAKVYIDSNKKEMSLFLVTIYIDEKLDLQMLFCRLHKIKGVIRINPTKKNKISF